MGDLLSPGSAALKEAAARDGLEGARVPSVAFRVLGEDGALHEVRSDEVFGGRTVVCFGLPGAFTPTCSATHVPRFNQLAPEFGVRGVHRLVCTAVNDPYVMAAWAKTQRASRIVFLPDAEGAFARGLGLLVEHQESGLGFRSRRYAMLVRDGRIDKAFVEPAGSGDPFGVSDADTMLAYIDPRAPALVSVAMFVRPGCPRCACARDLLEEQGLPFEEIELDASVTITAVRAVTGRSTVPQVFVRGRWIGGADELERYLAADGATVPRGLSSADAEAPPRRRLGGTRVLVVDDDAEMRDLLTALLGAAGADVRAAASAAEARATLASWWPSVLLSDIAMPGEDGYALIRAVRGSSDKRARVLPAAAVTAHVQDEDRRRAFAAGYQAHLSKPVDPDALIGLVARLAQPDSGVRTITEFNR